MKATLATPIYPNTKAYTGCPKTGFYCGFATVIFRKGKAYTAVYVRVYETAAKAYASVTIGDNCSWGEPRHLFYSNGFGTAKRAEYDRKAAAVQAAFADAGVTFDRDILNLHMAESAAKATAMALRPDADMIYTTEIIA